MVPDVCQWLYPEESGDTPDELCARTAEVGVERPITLGEHGVVFLCHEHRQEVNRPYDETLMDHKLDGCQWVVGRGPGSPKRLCNKPSIKEVKVPLGMGQSGVLDLCRVHNAQMNERNTKRRIRAGAK